jgi:hypothetical protein
MNWNTLKHMLAGGLVVALTGGGFLLGRSTRVDTMVAIEFAASCRPLRKSNASATITSAIRTGRASATASMSRSHVLDHDAADFIADVVEAIDHLFKMVIDLDSDEERHRVRGLVGAVELPQPRVVQLLVPAADAVEGGSLGGSTSLLRRLESRACMSSATAKHPASI